MSERGGKQRAVTAAALREALEYDPQTGVFRWRHRPNARACENTRFAGRVAGSVNSEGYSEIRLNGARLLAHRAAWLFIYGEWPQLQIDHLNGQRGDNRILNLRLASNRQNKWNSRTPKNNRCGAKGVRQCPVTLKWRAAIHKDGTTYHLGYHASRETASAAYLAKARELFGEFANAG